MRAGRITPLASPPPRDGETKGAGVKEHMSRFPPGKNADKNFCLITHIHKTYIRNPGDIIRGQSVSECSSDTNELTTWMGPAPQAGPILDPFGQEEM